MCNQRLVLFVVFLCVHFMVSCSDLSNSGQVVLEVGDNFQLANDNFPENTVFLIRSGIHKSQKVHNPKSGNQWIGELGAVLDGENTTSAAFTGKANNVTIQGVTITNYVDNGIYFESGSNVSINGATITDTGSGNGEKNGAIRLDRISELSVSNSHFERVVAGILPSYCTGPALIEWNSGLNIGRNFIQIDKCKGEGIEIKYNVMERQGYFLRGETSDVVDWISIFDSIGTIDSPIYVFRNRAKGHGSDPTGSFIMLGDEGGMYQLAEENIGVNPGQVGIGIAGGEFIVVRNNILYSNEPDFSNVAFYSADFTKTDTSPCNNHAIIDNRSYWSNGARQNNIWTDNKCTPMIKNNLFPDFSVNSNIWFKSFPD